MCIRDSLRTALSRGGARGGRADRAARRMRIRDRRGLRAAACLLYTSDAADERSSVDLGGRRIIKKKKKKRTEMQQSML